MGTKKSIHNKLVVNDNLGTFLQITLTICILLFSAFFIEGYSFYSLLFGSVLLSLILFFILKIEHKKPLKLVILFFFAVGFFPSLHCILYKVDKKNYRLDEEFSNYNIRLEKETLRKFKDSNLIRSYLTDDNGDLDSLPLKLLSYKQLRFHTELLGHSYPSPPRFGRPNSRAGSTRTVLCISDSVNNNIFSDSLFQEKSIRTYFLRYENQLAVAKRNIENSGHLLDRDIWVESISGFLFGDIKTVSTLAKIIRLIHLIIVYYLILMLSKLVESKKWIELKS